MVGTKLYAATNDNILLHALAPSFRWLIATALDGDVLTYGDLKRKLENEADFSTIFATRIGFVAGSLMYRIQDSAPDAPLINVLVVNQANRQPSEGAGSFMATRFSDQLLAEPDANKKYPERWTQAFNRAAAEVYGYGEENWNALYEKVFGIPLDPSSLGQERAARKIGTEDDGLPSGREYGAGGESVFHRDLRLWITANPGKVHHSFALAEGETEVDLLSGDRIDVVYRCMDRVILLEVKSRMSNDTDLKRGVYQCIKYRAVRAAMDVRRDPSIESYLVTENELPGEIGELLRLHNIKHFQAPLVRE